MKRRTVVIVVVALAASYLIATGDYRLIGLKSRMEAYAAITADHSVRIWKDVFESTDGSQTQVTETAKADDKDDPRIAQDNPIHTESGLAQGTPLLPSPKPDINRDMAARHMLDLDAGSGVPGRFQVISSSEKFPPVMIDTGTGASWFLNGETGQHDWIWLPIQHEYDAAVLSPVKP